MPEIKWKPNAFNGSTIEDCYVGKMKVGCVFYNELRPQGTDKRYRACSELPHMRMKPTSVDFDTVDEAKARVEQFVKIWFGWCGIDVSGNS